MSGHGMTLGLLAMNILLAGWLLTSIRRTQRDLSELKSSLRHIVQTLQHQIGPQATAPEPVPQASTSTALYLPPDAERLAGPQPNKAPKIEAFMAAIQAGSSMQDAAKRYGLTEDEALAISISYRSAASSSANSDAIS